MHKLYDLKDKLIEEMEDYSENGKFSKEDVESIKYLSSTVDHICNIIERCENEDGEYSGNMMPVYNRNRSYARGRNSYARKRDAMGRYSRASEDFRTELEDLIADAPNDHIRQKMQSIVADM